MQTPPLRSKIAKDRCTKSGLLADPRRQRTTRVDSAAPDACNGLCFGAGWQGDQLTHAVAQNTSGRGVLVNVRLEGRTFDRHVRPELGCVQWPLLWRWMAGRSTDARSCAEHVGPRRPCKRSA